MRVLLIAVAVALPCVAGAETPAEFNQDVEQARAQMGFATQANKCGFRPEPWASTIYDKLRAQVIVSAALTESAETGDQRVAWALGKLKSAVLANMSPTPDDCHMLASLPGLLERLDAINKE